MAVVALVAAVGLITLGIFNMAWLGDQLLGDPPDDIGGEARWTLELDARRTVIDWMVKAALVLPLAITAWLTWRRVSALEKQTELAEDGQVTERFTRSIEHLGTDQVGIRLGGLFALEALAHDAPERMAATVYEILVASLREWTRPQPGDDPKAPIAKQRRIGTDVETVLLILRRQRHFFDTHVESLPQGKDVGSGPHLIGTDLTRAWLVGADLRNATITEADFSHATITGTDFADATITSTSFTRATIAGTDFTDATINSTSFGRATIANTEYNGAMINSTGFGRATISRTYFEGAEIADTRFVRAKITASAFFDASLADVRFVGATMTKPYFSNALILRGRFDEATISDGEFGGATVIETSFARATITDTDFSEATLENVKFPNDVP